MPEVTIVVVNFHTASELNTLFRSAEHFRPFQVYDWVIVDNTPGGDALPPLPATASLQHLKDNPGFGTACNVAVRKASSPYIFLCNPDIRFTGPLDSLLPHITGDVAAACPLIEPRQRFQLRRFPTPGYFFTDFCGVVNLWPSNPISRTYYYDDHPNDRPFPVLQPAACCLLIDRDAFLDLGGFDPEFRPAWFEDVDLAYRVALQGQKILCDPRVRIAHDLGVSAKRLGRERFLKIYAANYKKFCRKHWGPFSRIFSETFLRLGMYARGVFSW